MLSRDKIRPTGQSLIDSIGQTNRVLLNIQQDYSTRKLTSDIKTYFEVHKQALEVLIFKGHRRLSLFFSPAGYEISLKQTSSHSPSNPLSLISGFAIA